MFSGLDRHLAPIDVFHRRSVIGADGACARRRFRATPLSYPPPALFRRSAPERVGGFDEALRTAEDLEFHSAHRRACSGRSDRRTPVLWMPCAATDRASPAPIDTDSDDVVDGHRAAPAMHRGGRISSRGRDAAARLRDPTKSMRVVVRCLRARLARGSARRAQGRQNFARSAREAAALVRRRRPRCRAPGLARMKAKCATRAT